MLDLPGLRGQLEEREKTRALTGTEAVAQLLEVAGEEAGRIAVAGTRLTREPLRLGTIPPQGGEESRLELENSVGNRLAAGEDRVNHGQAGLLEPEPPEVVMGCRVLEHALEGGIPDEERCVGLLAERDLLRVRK